MLSVPYEPVEQIKGAPADILESDAHQLILSTIDAIPNEAFIFNGQPAKCAEAACARVLVMLGMRPCVHDRDFQSAASLIKYAITCSHNTHNPSHKFFVSIWWQA